IRAEVSGSASARLAVVSTSALSQYRRFGSKKITGSSQAIDCWIMVYASAGPGQGTTRRPAVWAQEGCGDSLWWSPAPIPPPHRVLRTTGLLDPPRGG